MKIDIKRTRDTLQRFEFDNLFINELGWSQPNKRKVVSLTTNDGGVEYQRREIAQLEGVTVFEIETDTEIPDSKIRAAIHKETSIVAYENLLIFVDKERTQSLWYWVKRQNGKASPREHLYVKGQPGDLFLSKLDAIAMDIKELSDTPTVTEVADRLKQALDVERVTKKFYADFRTTHLEFLTYIKGIDNERDQRWYASVLLNRLMFIYFLQRKGFIDDNLNYLQDKLVQLQNSGDDLYYEKFLKTLFFEGFAKPEEYRSATDNALLGKIVYLNGGLFLPHPVELRWPAIQINDAAFKNLFDLFSRYSWNLDDTPGGQDDEINPDVLGYIFEKYINQKAFGAYYTCPEITEYLCRQTIHNLILEKVNEVDIPGVMKGRHFDSVDELLLRLDSRLCHKLYGEVLPGLSLLDPACGSGAFLVAAMKTLINIYFAVISGIERLNLPGLNDELKKLRAAHHSLSYYIKKRIITENLFGVDIMEEATEIARLRLFLALVASARSVQELEPLPNIEFNILAGNSLIGLLHVNEAEYQGHNVQTNMFQKPYHEIVAEKNRKISAYRHVTTYMKDLQVLRDDIQAHRDGAIPNLNSILLDEFNKKLGIKYEQATWDDAKNADGKAQKRALRLSDIDVLHPLHWGYEFDQVVEERGGFDAIITNPPWEIFKPQSKEFFAEYSNLVTKNKMTIKEFEEEQTKLLQNTEIRNAWLEYQSRFPYVSLFYRSATQYANQISMVNDKKRGTDINLYKLFTEQCYNLLREGGQCGIVIPSGIYTDLGTKQLRELLFAKTYITGLFGFENRKAIFEGVDSRFKFVVLTFMKGGQTSQFPAAFMRLNVTELDSFPAQGNLPMSVELIRKLSPDSLSIMEFKSDLDATIAQKMLKFPLLGEKIPSKWNLSMSAEFHMTNDSKLFKTEPSSGRLPLYEGKMVHQFTHEWANPRYWVDEKEGRKAVLGRKADFGQKLDYQDYRLGFRDIASNTNERTMICTLIPPTFHGNKLPTVEPFDDAGKILITRQQQIFLCAIWNSFVIDWMLRSKVTTTLNFFYIYQLPIPRLSEADPEFRPIVERAARLVCTTAEFKELWEAVIPNISWAINTPDGPTTNIAERAKIRAELDGLVAHLYDLTEADFVHILNTFPLVDKQVKDAALAAYLAFAPHPDDVQLATLIQHGESDRLEFKVAGYWNEKNKPPQKDESMKQNIIDGVAAFLNSYEGGSLIIGVADDKTIHGLAKDYDVANPPNAQGLKYKSNRDKYELWLHDVLKTGLGGSWVTHYAITFHIIGGQEVCRINVQPADKPVYSHNGSDIYVRRGGRKEKLRASEIADYIKKRWG